MADDPNKRRPQDSKRISLNEEWEVKWWAKELRVSEDELKKAVKAVGSSAEVVRNYLQKKNDLLG